MLDISASASIWLLIRQVEHTEQEVVEIGKLRDVLVRYFELARGFLCCSMSLNLISSNY